MLQNKCLYFSIIENIGFLFEKKVSISRFAQIPCLQHAIDFNIAVNIDFNIAVVTLSQKGHGLLAAFHHCTHHSSRLNTQHRISLANVTKVFLRRLRVPTLTQMLRVGL